MSRIILYVLRRDLRVSDNPVFHEISKTFSQSHSPYTHLLPLYVFPAQQVEVSGFLNGDNARTPYPEARSAVGGFWRCGPQRAQFLAYSVFALRSSLQSLGSGVEIRAGMLGDVVANVLDGFSSQSPSGSPQQQNDNTTSNSHQYSSDSEPKIVGVWMTAAEGVEERRDTRAVRQAVESRGIEFKIWRDESYFIDDRDIPVSKIADLPKVFTSYRKMLEPLRDCPRKALGKPTKLPPMPQPIPAPTLPFRVPEALEETISALHQPLSQTPDISSFHAFPKTATSAHPWRGGEQTAHNRMTHLLESGAATTYKDTRNGLLGEDFSTKLSAWLALGCITARQIHSYLLDFENGLTAVGKGAPGYGKGESKGSGWIRFELLWRDYMMLCARKYQSLLFQEGGFYGSDTRWRYPGPKDPAAKNELQRFLKGDTGMGLVDASMRELWLTGWTSNRARQNVASFLAQHLQIDWRVGAEWYERCLVDYDVCSNWANWQNVALTSRAFNPVKQGFDYDPEGKYVRTWVEEVAHVKNVEWVFQPWKGAEHDSRLKELDMATRPLKRIEYRSSAKKDGMHNNKKKGKGPRKNSEK